tara:strand:- start:1450 stop:1611 length:162 start_codon:yes stop_codon:yes gene_type:complete
MSDTWRIVATVRRELTRPSEHVGRPMSLKWVAAIWLVIVVGGIAGMHYLGLFG